MSTQKQEDSDRVIAGKVQDDVADLKTNVAVMKNDISSIKSTQQQMLGKMDNFSFVKQADFADYKKEALDVFAGKTDVKEVNTRVASLEDNQKWVVRLVLSFIILGLLAAAIKFGR